MIEFVNGPPESKRLLQMLLVINSNSSSAEAAILRSHTDTDEEQNTRPALDSNTLPAKQPHQMFNDENDVEPAEAIPPHSCFERHYSSQCSSQSLPR